MKETYIIAEAGVNHNGDIELAKDLIDVAARSGADYVKFQTFKAESLVIRSAPKAAYQNANLNNKDSQYQMLKGLELTEDMHKELIAHAKLKEINFLSTAFDVKSLIFLNSLELELAKIPSGSSYLYSRGSKNSLSRKTTAITFVSYTILGFNNRRNSK